MHEHDKIKFPVQGEPRTISPVHRGCAFAILRHTINPSKRIAELGLLDVV